MTTETDLPSRISGRAVLLWVLLAVLLVVVGVGLWVGIRGASAADELSTARDLATQLREEMTAGDADDVEATVGEAARHTAAAVSLTSDPVWLTAESVPLVGPNLAAVRASAQAVDDLVTRVVAPLAPLSGQLDAGSFAGASVSLQPLIDAGPVVGEARAAAEKISGSVGEIPTGGTLPFVQDAVSELSGAVDEVTQAVSAIDRATALLPGMLGADGPRNYLVLFQNNAELRASGGLAGATAVLTATDGAISLAAQRSSQDYPRLREPVLPLTAAELALHGSILGTYVQDVNLTPDFSRTGELAKAMAEPVVGMPIHGVVAIDPYVLSYVLAATGPVELANGSMLTSDNAVRVLLSDVYAEIGEPTDQDAFFASVTREVFAALTTGDPDPAKLLSAIAQGSDEGRIRIWSADAAEQAALAETTLAGVPSATEPVIGVYLNDATGGKMGYYLDGTVTMGCSEQGSRVTVRLGSEAPADAATSLTAYVTGAGHYGVPAGSIRTQVLVVLPSGARVTTPADSASTVVRDDAGRVVVSHFLEIEPGGSAQVAVDYTDADGARIETTPGLGVASPEGGQAKCR